MSLQLVKKKDYYEEDSGSMVSRGEMYEAGEDVKRRSSGVVQLKNTTSGTRVNSWEAFPADLEAQQGARQAWG